MQITDRQYSKASVLARISAVEKLLTNLYRDEVTLEALDDHPEKETVLLTPPADTPHPAFVRIHNIVQLRTALRIIGEIPAFFDTASKIEPEELKKVWWALREYALTGLQESINEMLDRYAQLELAVTEAK